MECDSANGGEGDRAYRLLLCDDSPGERRALGELLRREGYEVDEAGDGRAALLLLECRQIDLLLLDLQMPMMDGFEVLRQLQGRAGDVAVILLSGMPLEGIQDQIHSLPSHQLPPLFIKPVDPDQLLAVIELRLAGELPGQ